MADSQPRYCGYDRDAFKLLAESSVRRLFALRHCERDGADARRACRNWLADLRNIRRMESKEII